MEKEGQDIYPSPFKVNYNAAATKIWYVKWPQQTSQIHKE
jgi:hypothetical protein